MKISINSAIFNAVAARMTSTAAKYTAIAVQKGVADSNELSGLTALASELPFFANLKEKATKIVTISKEAEQLNIEINDDYIIGSINLGFDLYDRVADSVVSMIKEIDIWNKESQQFEAKWAEDCSTDEIVSDIIKQAEKHDNHFGVTKQSTNGIELVDGVGSIKTVYAPDIDKQVTINALNVYRPGEEAPYRLSTATVSCICQTESNLYFYVGGSFDLPICVINAVRGLYDLPLFPTKDEVEANEKDREARRAAEFKAEQEAKKAELTNTCTSLFNRGVCAG